MNVTLDSYTHRALEVCATAARTCYSSDTPEDIELTYEQQVKLIDKVIKSGHLSVIEHANFTFHISGVSRAFLAQLSRHRLCSLSVQSQRYVNMGNEPDVVYPPSIMKDENLAMHFDQLMKDIWAMYDYLISEGVPAEDARYVLPNACVTNIVITVNARELFHIFEERCCNKAQQEFRDVAWKMLEECNKVCPEIFKYAGPKCWNNKCIESKPCGNPPKKIHTF